MRIAEHNGQRIRVYTVNEAALTLGVHRDTVRRWGDAGTITEIRTQGKDKQRLYLVSEIDAIRDGRAESAAIYTMTPEEARAELVRRGVTVE